MTATTTGAARGSARSVVLDGDLDPTRFAHLLPASGPVAPTLAQLTHRAREIVTRADWREMVRFDPAHRWRLLLHQEAAYEAWLMSWLPGQRTGWHDHGEATAVIAVAQGELREHTSAPDGVGTRVHTIGAEHVRIWGARHVREIVNASAEPAVSVHLYPKLTATPPPHR
jgi:predicted metal-dependent enzyme (double-stranded beta helix superfamily)